MSITQNAINAVNTFPSHLFFNGESLGILHEDDINITIDSAVEGFGSHGTGENGHFLSLTSGTHAQIEFTLRGLNKDVIQKLYDHAMSSSDTSDSDYKAGQVTISSHPKVINKIHRPLVIYPLVDDGTTKFGANDDNPFTIGIFNFIVTEPFEWSLSTTDTANIVVTGEGQVDVLNNNLVAVIGVGIEPNGTYTPPVVE